MYIIGGILALIGAAAIYDACKKKENDNKTDNKKEKGKSIAIGIAFLVIGVCIFVASSTGGNSKTSKWDSLSKEEKQWYERNYGDGKSEQYTKTIEDYKKNH